MPEKCLPSQMTGFNAYFSLLKEKADIPYQRVIDYVHNFGIYRKTLSLICSLCFCVIVIVMVCSDPESGTDHSVKEVSAYIICCRLHTWGFQGKCHRLFSVLFCVYLQIIYM